MGRKDLKSNILKTSAILALTAVASTAQAQKFNPYGTIKKNLMGDKLHHHNKEYLSAYESLMGQSKSPGAVQVCKQSENKIETLPYWNPSDQFPCMYSGTFQTSLTPEQDHNLFYWLIKNTKTTESPNLVIWLDGGPGSTSMEGLFIGNGPLRVKRTGAGLDDFIVGLNPEGSWADQADVLYLDQPVDAGFSYGNSIIDRMEDGAQEFIKFMQAFAAVYPEYNQANQGRKIYLSGWSYAGKYIPVYVHHLKQNNEREGQIKFEIGGVMIGDPLASPIIMRTQSYTVAQALNVIDESNFAQVESLRRKCEQMLTQDWAQASDTCDGTLNYITDVSGGLITFDARKFDYDWNPISDVVDDFFGKSIQKEAIYKAIHIDKSTRVPIYQHMSDKIYQAFKFEKMLDYSYWYNKLIENNIKTLIYAGEWDQRSGPVTVDSFLQGVPNLNKHDFWTQARKVYYVKKTDGTYVVGGYYREDKEQQFTFLTLPKAGHFAAGDQILVTNQFLTDYQVSDSLICHKDKQLDCQNEAMMCQHMNFCNNHGTCQSNGQCTCLQGFKSADCSEQAVQLVPSFHQKFETNGTQWIYFQFSQGLSYNHKYEFTLSSKQPIDLYISTGSDSDPNEFSHDLAFKGQNYMTIQSDHFPSLSTFVAAVKINGIDFYNNAFHLNNLIAKFDVKSL
ncbi:serine carboxypeptidase [Stylonychia lemnae]|uniref:Serine carboxypeptidase n=1 Tax=Stylonychia lemnae TaxID=5949 RepID=A0A078B459_STYLE|nr:serine carboxypeptidase [Stylonychia lemnae]|eukprot:CDW88293.1 serine carboxypeptidase [Stylonychia lemnae]